MVWSLGTVWGRGFLVIVSFDYNEAPIKLFMCVLFNYCMWPYFFYEIGKVKIKNVAKNFII